LNPEDSTREHGKEEASLSDCDLTVTVKREKGTYR